MFAGPDRILGQRNMEPVTDGKYYQIYVWIGQDLVTVLVCGMRVIASRDSISETGVGIRDRLQANIACFLASDAASYISGTAINVDGARSPVV